MTKTMIIVTSTTTAAVIITGYHRANAFCDGSAPTGVRCSATTRSSACGNRPSRSPAPIRPTARGDTSGAAIGSATSSDAPSSSRSRRCRSRLPVFFDSDQRAASIIRASGRFKVVACER